MKNRVTAATVIALIAVIGMIGTGCERLMPASGVAGTWRGTVTIGSGSASSSVQTALVLRQSGSTVTGSLGSGTVNGTLNGSQLELDLVLGGLPGHISFTHSGSKLLNGSGYVKGSVQIPLTFSTLTRS
ncbi:MAG: hypothetical protein HQ559_00070 [Lentisphaerae bacterium]|nr:hypothetical protein [Lentisphaerota bacterium]